MQLGIIGLGRMGRGLVARLQAAGHDCVAYDADAAAARALAGQGVTPAASLADLIARLTPPRAVWIMVPAAAVDGVIDGLVPLLAAGDTLIDGGNSHFRDDRRRAAALSAHGLHYVDVGTSGGVHGRDRGFCLMIGGEVDVVARLDPIFAALAPGEAGVPPAATGEGRATTAARGYLHCGPAGAGHFVKMVHNGIEYGLMAAYAEGLNVLHGAAGDSAAGIDTGAPGAPREGDDGRYRFDIPAVAELWRRGSVIGSWLLDLTAAALARDPRLERFDGRVGDSGEGRWIVQTAVDQGVPLPVISAALYARFSSRGEARFADQVQSAMRQEFGGHLEGKDPG